MGSTHTHESPPRPGVLYLFSSPIVPSSATGSYLHLFLPPLAYASNLVFSEYGPA